jgi:4-hydroxy-4-methyl-2-oxoglutarate aldolase
MDNQALSDAFALLSTPLIADACLRLGVPLRLAPTGIRAVVPDSRLAGCVLPVRHYGSVDVFLEAMGAAEPGDVLVIDNGGRLDEACIGDLTVLEARSSGIAGIVVWGLHRDSPELAQIGLPVYSYGTCPAGPRRLDAAEAEALVSAHVGDEIVDRADAAFADQDGVVFVPRAHAEQVLHVAHTIWETEREQAAAIRSGRNLRAQLSFDEYLDRRSNDPGYTFRRPLRRLGGAIEE